MFPQEERMGKRTWDISYAKWKDREILVGCEIDFSCLKIIIRRNSNLRIANPQMVFDLQLLNNYHN